MGKSDIVKSISQYENILADVRKGVFKPFYLLMGEEPFFADTIIAEIEQRALTPDEKHFNQLIVYGSDITPSAVVEAARKFPMLSGRQLIIVKEAQLMAKPDVLELYFNKPVSTTILVLAFTGKSIDKRTTLYKSAVANGCVFESYSIYHEMVHSWLQSYLRQKGCAISPEAGILMAEYCGTDLRKLSLELEKLISNLKEGSVKIDVSDIERNIGISRDYNVFELTKALSLKDGNRAMKIVKHFGASPRQFPLTLSLSALFSHFSRLLKYHALLLAKKNASKSEIAGYIGIIPYFMPEYERAASNYPLIKCMEAISLIRKYDSVSKSNLRGESGDGDLLFELVFKIINR